MSKESFPYSRQWVSEEDVARVVEVLRGDWLTTGPVLARFEEKVAATCESRYAAAVSSGTAALHAAYFAAGVGVGDEVATTPLTFASTANAALFLGADVRFVDVEPDTGLMDAASLEDNVNTRTKLIVPIDYAGHPADYDAIHRVAEKRSVSVVADACHSLGARYYGKAVGSLAHMTAFSFHPVKPVTSAEGGAVVTDDVEADRLVRLFRHHGLERDPDRRSQGTLHQEMHVLGFNYRLSDVHAALGLSQLERFDAFVSRRRQIAERYDEGLADVSALRLPVVRGGASPGWHLYVVRIAGDAAKRDEFLEHLRSKGVGAQLHFPCVHHHPFDRKRMQLRHEPCPNAADFAERAVSIPLYPRMTDDQVDRVMESVRSAAREVL